MVDQQIEHCYGSGRSFTVSDQAIDEGILKTQLEQYVYHAAELADLQTSGIYILKADCVRSRMYLTLLAKKDTQLLYQEKLTQWRKTISLVSEYSRLMNSKIQNTE